MKTILLTLALLTVLVVLLNDFWYKLRGGKAKEYKDRWYRK